MNEPLKYISGEEIKVGDVVNYGGSPGRIVVVVPSKSFSADYPEKDWSYLDSGFIIETRDFGLMILDDPQEEEDLILVSPAVNLRD